MSQYTQLFIDPDTSNTRIKITPENASCLAFDARDIDASLSRSIESTASLLCLATSGCGTSPGDSMVAEVSMLIANLNGLRDVCRKIVSEAEQVHAAVKNGSRPKLG